MPIAKALVEHLQVVKRGARGSQHVTAVITKHVLPQVKVFARAGHELPHARCARAGLRLRIEGTFDERQQRQIQRHLAALDFFNDVKEVAPAALCDAQHVVWARGIKLFPLAHQRGIDIGHGKTLAHTLPEIDRGTGQGSRLQAGALGAGINFRC